MVALVGDFGRKSSQATGSYSRSHKGAGTSCTNKWYTWSHVHCSKQMPHSGNNLLYTVLWGQLCGPGLQMRTASMRSQALPQQ